MESKQINRERLGESVVAVSPPDLEETSCGTLKLTENDLKSPCLEGAQRGSATEGHIQNRIRRIQFMSSLFFNIPHLRLIRNIKLKSIISIYYVHFTSHTTNTTYTDIGETETIILVHFSILLNFIITTNLGQ